MGRRQCFSVLSPCPLLPGHPLPGHPLPGNPLPGQPRPGQPLPGDPLPGHRPSSNPPPRSPLLRPFPRPPHRPRLRPPHRPLLRPHPRRGLAAGPESLPPPRAWSRCTRTRSTTCSTSAPVAGRCWPTRPTATMPTVHAPDCSRSLKSWTARQKCFSAERAGPRAAGDAAGPGTQAARPLAHRGGAARPPVPPAPRADPCAWRPGPARWPCPESPTSTIYAIQRANTAKAGAIADNAVQPVRRLLYAAHSNSATGEIPCESRRYRRRW